MSADWRWFTVDRIEGTIAVLLGDDGTSHDVPLRGLPAGTREDQVLRVPLGDRAPRWKAATPDDQERAQRLARSKAVLDELKKQDPGGDITL